ncbi:MAG TPA: phosphomannomutase, partial [Stellaceae bacterium]|nr:phosphomannomutase [Stellaceae bacterium]
MSHRLDPTILREYDIRGIVGKNLSAADARAIGRAYAVTVAAAGGAGTPSVAVGYDGRLTSPELEAALTDGLAAGGVDVVRVGRGPTPMLYYAAATLGVDAGVMVTGSHNPPDYNGFKFVLAGKPFYGAAIQKLGETVAALGAAAPRHGRISERAVREDYIDRLLRDYDGARPLRVAWDVGNGATGEVVQQL